MGINIFITPILTLNFIYLLSQEQLLNFHSSQFLETIFRTRKSQLLHHCKWVSVHVSGEGEGRMVRERPICLRADNPIYYTKAEIETTPPGFFFFLIYLYVVVF